MRVISLEPFFTKFVYQLGQQATLVGTSQGEPVESVAIVTRKREPEELSECSGSTVYRLEEMLCSEIVDINLLISLQPEILLISIPAHPDYHDQILARIKEDLAALLGYQPKVRNFAPHNLDQIFEMFEGIALAVGERESGRAHGQRIKAQMMDWGSNFYDRMKNKRATFLSSIRPFRLASLWIPDMIHLCSGISQLRYSSHKDPEVSWNEILSFKPDVLVVAPRGSSIKESMACFKTMEKQPGWDDIPAVKRGEVYFTEGQRHFYMAGQEMIESTAILVSALAGFESGYITPRDCFFKLRWLELQRHRI